jgi:hypothetical protein
MCPENLQNGTFKLIHLQSIPEPETQCLLRNWKHKSENVQWKCFSVAATLADCGDTAAIVRDCFYTPAHCQKMA